MSSKHKMIAEFIRNTRTFNTVSLETDKKKRVEINGFYETVDRKKPQYFIHIRYDEGRKLGKYVPRDIVFIGNHINKELTKCSKRSKPYRKLKYTKELTQVNPPAFGFFIRIIITQNEYQKLKATGLFPMKANRFVNSP